MTLKFNSEAELFTARRDILRRCMPHGNLWGWGDEQRRDSISAANADPPPEPTKARLLVLVNPAAGKGRGVAAYEREWARTGGVPECVLGTMDVLIDESVGVTEQRGRSGTTRGASR